MTPSSSPTSSRPREDVGEDVGVVECGLYAILCVGETSVLHHCDNVLISMHAVAPTISDLCCDHRRYPLRLSFTNTNWYCDHVTREVKHPVNICKNEKCSAALVVLQLTSLFALVAIIVTFQQVHPEILMSALNSCNGQVIAS